jgi:hypothetical protein
MFFVLKNLASMSTERVEAPWDLQLSPPAGMSKEEHVAWAVNPATKHAFVSSVEGMSSIVRIGPNNPPVKMHGLVIDYDTFSVTTDRLRDLAVTPPCEFLPAYGSLSNRKGAKLYWTFERPIPISSGVQATRFLSRLFKELKLNKWLPGFDAGASANLSQYYDVGKEFVNIGGTPIKHDVLAYWAWEATRDAVLWTDHARYKIPLDAVEAEVNERFPGRWKGRFVEGARGVRFWDASADNPTGAQVRADGVTCYTGDRAFMSWYDIFGLEFVSRFAAAKMSTILESTYFDGQKFYVKLSEELGGRYVSWGKDDFSQYLRTKKFNPSKVKGATCSEVDEVEQAIKQQREVDYAKRLVHYPKGLVLWRGRRFLNMGAPEPIRPADPLPQPLSWSDGDKFFPLIKGFADCLFMDEEGKDEFNQRTYVFAWLKRFYEGGLALRPSQGQVVIIAGPPDKGKSFFCEGIVGGLMGGCEDGVDHLVDNGHWTANIAESPVIYVGDSRAAEDYKTATAFSNQLKKIVANATMRSAQKFGKEGDVPWYGRIMISCNLDSESLNILPNMELSNQDKILLFKASDTKFKFPPRSQCEAALEAELPYFARFLLDWHPPDSVLSESHRFGVRKFHHHELFAVATSQGSSGVLADFLQSFIKADAKVSGDKRKSWRGTSPELYAAMAEFNQQFSKEFRTVRAFQTSLGHVKSSNFLKIDCLRERKQSPTWVIHHPEDPA